MEGIMKNTTWNIALKINDELDIVSFNSVRIAVKAIAAYTRLGFNVVPMLERR